MIKKIALFNVFCSLFSISALTMSYSEKAPYFYGSGVDPLLPFVRKEICLDFAPPHQIDVISGVTKIKFESKIITSQKDELQTLTQKTDFEASVFWNGAKVEGHYSLSKDYENHLISDDVMMVISAEGSFGRKTSPHFSLKREYQDLLERGSLQEFLRRCGSYYIGMEYNNVEVKAIIKSHGMSRSLKTKIIHDLGAKVTSSFGGVEAKRVTNELIDSLSKYSSLDISFVANSGRGFVDLGKLIKSSSKVDYDKIVDAIGDYVAGIDASNTPPSFYEAYPFSSFGVPIQEINKKKQRFLEKAYLEYLNLITSEEKLNKIEEQTKGSFGVQRSQINRYKVFIETMGMNCYEKDLCDGTIPTLQDLNLEHLKDPILSLECQYINTKNPRVDILGSIGVSLQGKFALIHTLNTNTLQILSEDSIDGSLKQETSFKLSLAPQTASNLSKQFIIYVRKEELFTKEIPSYNQTTLAIVEAAYNRIRSKKYYLKISDKNDNQYFFYLGVPLKECSLLIDRR